MSWNNGASLGMNLAACRKDAKELATCVACCGVGEDRWNEGRACPTCAGSGRAAREPHVLALCDVVEQQQAVVDNLDGALLEERHLRAEQAEHAAGLARRVDTLSEMLNATLDRAAHAESEAGELRRELDRARCDLYQLRDELQQLRATRTTSEAT